MWSVLIRNMCHMVAEAADGAARLERTREKREKKKGD
jgi:hypothetical protein